MKRRSAQEREEADARERAEARRQALIEELRAHQAAARPTAAPAHDTEAPEAPEAPEAAEAPADAAPKTAADEEGEPAPE